MAGKKKGFQWEKGAPLFREWLVVLLNFFHFTAVYFVICSMFGVRNVRAFYFCALLALPFLLYTIRCKCGDFRMFLGMHLAAVLAGGAILYLVSASLVEKILFAVIWIFYEFLSFYLRGTEEERKETVLHPAVSVSVCVILYFLQNIKGDAGAKPLLAGLTVAYLCLYFIYYYLDNYLDFVKVNRISAGKFQGRKLFHSGVSTVGGYVLASAVILIVCTNQSLGRWLGRGLKAFLRFLLSGITGEGGETGNVEPESFVEQPFIEPEEWGTGVPGMFWEILDKILEICVSLLILAVLVVLAAFVVKWVRGIARNKSRKVVLESEGSIRDFTEDIARNPKEKNKKPLFYGLTNNARIRKAYAGCMKSRKKFLEAQMKKKLSSSTARECVQALEPEEETGALLVRIYEEARYSGKECGSAGLHSFKHALNQLRR